MSQASNPYAPPKASLEPTGNGNCWRDGKVLVMLADTPLPHRCIKCNAPAVTPVKKRKVYWHHPALYLLLLVNVIIYAVVALIVRRTATVAPGLCPEHRKRRLLGLWLGWGGSLAGLALFFFGLSVDKTPLILVGPLLIVAAIVGGIVFARVVYPQRIEKDYVRLKGCSEEFLASLPDFPG
jgi:hypothetical protein